MQKSSIKYMKCLIVESGQLQRNLLRFIVKKLWFWVKYLFLFGEPQVYDKKTELTHSNRASGL